MSIFDWAINKTFGKKITSKAQAIAEPAIAEAKQEAMAQVDQGLQQIKTQLGYGYYGGTVNAYSNQSGGAKWPHGMSGGSGLILNHFALRHNARRAYHDTPQTKALIDRYADTVADIGLMLEPTPKFNILGITPENAEQWALDVGERFDSWARSKQQHRAATLTFYQSQRLYQIFQHRDGEVFPRFYYSQDRKLLNPLQFSFIDPDQIRGDAFTSNYGPCTNDDGIIRDSQGREKAYKIWIQKPNKPGHFDMKTIPAVGEKSKRIFMLHGFAPEYAGQGRGYSRLSHALQEFENLTDFTAAQIKKAIIQSSINLYVKPSPDASASNPFKDVLTDHAAGPAAEQFGSDPTPTEDALQVPNVSYARLPEATLDTPGSVAVFNLKGGEDLKAFEGKSPAESYNKFVDSFVSHLSASMSMPVEVLLMKFNQNYSASRASLILFWRVAVIWREEMASDYLNPTYEMWLAGEIAANRIFAPGWSDPRLRAAWINSRWIGSPMPNIDPSKTAKADQAYIEMGSQTLERVARNHNGSSAAANMPKLKREIDQLTAPPWSKGANKGRKNQ